MKRVLFITLGLVLVTGAAYAQSAPAPTPNQGPRFVDANGDGICDLFQSGNPQGKGTRAGKGGYGPGNGTGNQGIGPRDGSGYGPGLGAGTGVCDGTGPKGKQVRRGGGPR